MAERKGDTRGRIQVIALELFAEQGYEKTSLREIAERLGVTKAALYYHFRTKDDIVASLFADFRDRVDEIIEWAGDQEMTDALRADVVRRYAGLLAGQGSAMIAFVQGNQSAVRDLESSGDLLERFRALSNLLSAADAPLKVRLKQALALPMLHVGYFGLFAPDAQEDDRRAAALEVALELLTG